MDFRVRQTRAPVMALPNAARLRLEADLHTRGRISSRGLPRVGWESRGESENGAGWALAMDSGGSGEVPEPWGVLSEAVKAALVQGLGGSACEVRPSPGQGVQFRRLVGPGGNGTVFRARYGPRSVIVKRAERRERFFYEKMAWIFHGAGVAIPRCLLSNVGPEKDWMILDDVGEPLPKSRWGADPETIRGLARLHTVPARSPLPTGDEIFRPEWSLDMTFSALEFFPEKERPWMRRRLEAARDRCVPLLSEANCWISGDPNPTNWGVRPNGEAVLFDWERFGFGIPAIDLAILVPGMGSPDGSFERRVAEVYAEQGGAVPPDSGVRGLVEQMRLMKVWSTVEFLAARMRRGEAGDLDWLAAAFPGFLSFCVS